MHTFRLLPLLVLLLSACGQTGPLWLPPTCSPVKADGSIVETTDEDGNVPPPCPPPEAPAPELLDDGTGETPDDPDQDLR